MALEGTLRDFSLADILQLISLQNKTGLLTLRSPADTVTLGFMEGRLVSAESSAKRIDTRLGTVLVKTGRLKGTDLAKALETQSQTLQRLGYILLRNGYCSADDLREGLDIQIRKIVYSLFRWTDGDYIFDQQDHIDYDTEFVTPILVESLLMEGARMIDEWPIIERVITSMDLVYQKRPVAQPVIPAEGDEAADDVGESTLERRAREKRAGPIKISVKEWAVYQLIDGVRPVHDIVDQSFLSEFDGCKAFYDLVSRGLIEERREQPAAPGKKASATLAFVLGSDSRLVLVAVVGGVLLAVSLWFQARNPLNMLSIPPRRNPVVEGLDKSVSLLRLRRLAEAVDTYYFTSGKFPDKIDALVEARFVTPPELIDPYGRRYGYHVQAEKCYLVGFDPEGKTDIDLLMSIILRRGTPADTLDSDSSDATAPARTRPGKEIIVIQ